MLNYAPPCRNLLLTSKPAETLTNVKMCHIMKMLVACCAQPPLAPQRPKSPFPRPRKLLHSKLTLMLVVLCVNVPLVMRNSVHLKNGGRLTSALDVSVITSSLSVIGRTGSREKILLNKLRALVLLNVRRNLLINRLGCPKKLDTLPTHSFHRHQ